MVAREEVVVAVAWMRMMGAESVAYHRATVLERGDDHPSQALAYYASRGETPLVWGGAGAALGLSGAVDPESYEAIFGPGGARNLNGDRLVSARRPGMELVISAHKSVAEMGVIGRAEDMHSIMDAERDATLSYLHRVTKSVGGRRGRASVSAPTGGVIYAHTRHATSRAGDPCPHDHVLVANVVEMLDEAGGWKAANTSLWREHLHAATMAGRVAAARMAVELGYGIEADGGPSGRLGQWRIAGIPDEVLALHSKRAAEITVAVEERGETSYQARQVAARTTRSTKEHIGEGPLVARWQAELASIGWPAARLLASVQACSGQRIASKPSLGEARRVLAEVLDGDGDLARRKVFSRRHLVVAVAPHLYGWDPGALDAVVDRALADPAVVPLIGTGTTIERAYSLASVLATEGAIADTLERSLTRTDASACAEKVGPAIAAVEADLGASLSEEQRRAAEAICTSGRGAELVVGVAGAGKTTMLAAVAGAYQAAGCDVMGTATAGQAARTLGAGAGLRHSATLASLAGDLQRGRRRLGETSVVILDEAAMTDDVDLARLLTHVEAAGAKLIAVGDHRQLGSVGPGGALAALVARHPDAVHQLNENRRQTDPDERAALDQLRDGDVSRAIAWCTERDRIQTRPDRDGALQGAVNAWAVDVAAGADTVLLAWRRANVAELNSRARAWMGAAGRLTGPELFTADGGAYRAGDRLVALTPDHQAGLVTSQRAVVRSVHPDDQAVTVDTDDGRQVTLSGDQLSAERLGYAYATTVHRCKGATVDRAHLFADGGGRELAYVALSRARERSTAWVVADDAAQAAEDLTRDWASRRTPAWALDTGLPDPHHLGPKVANQLNDDQRIQVVAIAAARANTTVRAATGLARPEPIGEPVDARTALTDARAALADLPSGEGTYQGTAIGEAASDALRASIELGRLEHESRHAPGRRERRQASRQLPDAAHQAQASERRLQDLVGPETDRLHDVIATLEDRIAHLDAVHHRLTRRWEGLHEQRAAAGGDARRLGRLVDRVRDELDRPRQLAQSRPHRPSPSRGRALNPATPPAEPSTPEAPDL